MGAQPIPRCGATPTAAALPLAACPPAPWGGFVAPRPPNTCHPTAAVAVVAISLVVVVVAELLVVVLVVVVEVVKMVAVIVSVVLVKAWKFEKRD